MSETGQGEARLDKDSAGPGSEPGQSADQLSAAADAMLAADDAARRDPDLTAEIERLEAEKADLTDRLLRLAADMDNLRRRTERELSDARKYAVQRFAADMLVVGDNLKRALEAIPAERRQAGDEAFGALVEGVDVTRREMQRLLEKNGITRIAAEGERFDPNRHQAMFEVPDAGVPAGTVVQVVQDGFAIGDRVLRAALVGVAKGDGKAAGNGGPAVQRDAAEVSEPAA